MRHRQLSKSIKDGESSRNEGNETHKSNKTKQRKTATPVELSSAWSRFWGRLSFMKYVILVLILPPVINYASLQRESQSLMPVQGELIDVGWGQKMFIKCLGIGLPTVILDAPTGGTSDMWYLIQEKLSKVTKVCAYDRAGLGFSSLPHLDNFSEREKTETRKLVSQVATLQQMSHDLHHLVTEAKLLPRPLILVGSETGGLIARHYALTYPRDVIDIVLINPMVEDLFEKEKEEWNDYWHSHVLPSLQSLHLSAFIGLSRIAALIGWLKPDIVGVDVPREVEYRQFYHLCNPSHMNSVFFEHLLLNTSFSQMNEVWDVNTFPENISVTVINSRHFEKIPSQLHEAWEQSQQYLLNHLHPKSNHVLYEGPHGSLYNDPETITNSVRQLISKWRISVKMLPNIHTPQETFSQ